MTTITWSAGNHNVTIYVNDTYGNNNQSSVSFNISVDGGSGDGGGSGGGGGGGDSESGDSISDGESSEDSISDGEGSEDSGSDVGDEDFQLEEVNPPENFVCENWKACSLDYGLDLLQSSTIKLSEEQIRVCNDGSIETIQRRACRSEQPNIIKKVNNLLFGKGVDILNSKEDPLVNLVLYSVVEDGILIDKLDFNFPITGRFIDDSVGNVPDQGFFSTILHFLKVFLDMVTH